LTAYFYPNNAILARILPVVVCASVRHTLVLLARRSMSGALMW